MDLHRETRHPTTIFLDDLQIGQIMSITLDWPYEINDISVQVEYPKGDLNHLSRIYATGIRNQQVLYHQWKVPFLEYPELDYATLRSDMNRQLKAWYATVPCPEKVVSKEKPPQQAWWDALHSAALLLLHRPSHVTRS
ncbi:hypothetical protein DTO164E3_1931 [Paecilomyces variotii]|nr:hypothetical protein DTO032I3_7875 [Paecilomyces variotii]KAJ9204169.1 hypothetical protein DTO164E3_1931 [Paecilomyces variotii]KAJ9275160.1 hypothetical protein DTO021D3_8027 [Paecilomyces variotii]KAJ9376948.1 hypothetical protein DTO032I4_8368 [Paecilomyces variotii]